MGKHSHDHKDHGHNHSRHAHAHAHAPSGEKNLLISIVLNMLITVAEIIGGIMSGSLALLSDAFHNFSDVISMIISYIAILVGKKSKNAGKTYGYKRAEILAALFNVIALFVVCGYIIYEAVMRFSHPQPIKSGLMIIVATVGLLGNGISVLLLFKNAKENINIRSAFLHLIGDTVSSVAVIIIAAILLFKPWYILDTIASILIAVYILKESIAILMESLNILMQGAPKGLDYKKIKEKLMALPRLGIKDIHHIHAWDITPGNTIFDAHIVVEKTNLSNADEIIEKINVVLSKEFGICHSTIQLESEGFSHCVSCEL
jgi:cobalt-zinc-cadmium efflux system protein